MKKTFCILTVLLVMAVLLTGCDQPVRDPSETTGSLPQQTEAPTEQPTEEITISPNTPVTGSVTGFHTWTLHAIASHIDHQPTAFVICSYKQWESYCAFYTYSSDLLSKYDSDYFQSHSLVVYCKSEGSGSITASVQNVQVENEKLVVTVQRNVPAFGTDDVRNWSIFIEIEGDVSLDEDSDVTITLVEKATESD